jgi:hypothetical protein
MEAVSHKLSINWSRGAQSIVCFLQEPYLELIICTQAAMTQAMLKTIVIRREETWQQPSCVVMCDGQRSSGPLIDGQ